MSSPLTIEEIATIAQVSRSTVSRVLNNHPSVRREVRDRVLQVIEEHNYAPRAAARSLASSRTNVLGLLIPRSAALIFSDPFFPLVIHGITEECSAHDYFLMLSMMSVAREPSFYHRILRARHLDGLILLSNDLDDPILPLLIQNRTPLALIGRHPAYPDLNWVDVENRTAACLAVQHLIGLGHRRVATISGPLTMVAGIDRRDGYKQALFEAGLPLRPELLVEGDFTQEGGYRAMQALLALARPPSAVFIASDTMALGALRAIHERGLRVPDDLALVGFDDSPLALMASPQLTTMRQPMAGLGAAAVRLLVRQLEDPALPPQQETMGAELVVRASCGGSKVKSEE